MNEQLCVAVVGAGHMGRHHARTIAAHPECRLVAVVDRDEGRAIAVATEHGGKPLTSLEHYEGKLDAVTVAVPTVAHAEVAIPLMERGLPVLVEKPLADNTTAVGRSYLVMTTVSRSATSLRTRRPRRRAQGRSAHRRARQAPRARVQHGDEGAGHQQEPRRGQRHGQAAVERYAE